MDMQAQESKERGRPAGGTRQLRLGLVGCGRLAQRCYRPAIERATGVRLAALADHALVRCASLSPEVPAFGSAQALIDAGGVDALIIATPSTAHLADARVAAEAGLPALIEKPPGVNAAEAAKLANLSPAPWVGFNRRFEPALVAMRNALPTDKSVELSLTLEYWRAMWRPYMMRDDALLDLAPHLLDLARWLTRSEFRRARARSLGDRYARVEVELENGRAVLRCATNRPYRERFQVLDEAGAVIGCYRRGDVVRGVLARLQPKPENPMIHSLTRQIEAFAGDRRSAELATAEDGLAVMAAIEAARLSASRDGEWTCVTIPAIG